MALMRGNMQQCVNHALDNKISNVQFEIHTLTSLWGNLCNV